MDIERGKSQEIATGALFWITWGRDLKLDKLTSQKRDGAPLVWARKKRKKNRYAGVRRQCQDLRGSRRRVILAKRKENKVKDLISFIS